MQADHKKVERYLKTARGQIDGILKMIEEDKYCIDIVNQVLASEALLSKAAKQILLGHIQGCIVESFESDDKEYQAEKMAELSKVLDRIAK